MSKAEVLPIVEDLGSFTDGQLKVLCQHRYQQSDKTEQLFIKMRCEAGMTVHDARSASGLPRGKAADIEQQTIRYFQELRRRSPVINRSEIEKMYRDIYAGAMDRKAHSAALRAAEALARLGGVEGREQQLETMDTSGDAGSMVRDLISRAASGQIDVDTASKMVGQIKQATDIQVNAAAVQSAHHDPLTVHAVGTEAYKNAHEFAKSLLTLQAARREILEGDTDDG